ncbi:uncharacterized protein LOC129586022 [Paramacrobiotus metropolitanus]|uniref:uncharacterized protein LOC129586022 n=1 Tax=Paramacrobiotus metropolitanus TaxID=2943436 RepID=UPI00244603F5|nr:uncharacterized protein LOC129586022 [Paramacrobiotus metropolitanus]
MDKDIHLLVIALPAYGHLIPTLELARSLSTFHTVTFAASAQRTTQLSTKHHFHPTPSEDITVRGIDDGIPEDVPDPQEFANRIMHSFFPAVERLLRSVPTGTEPGAVDAVITDNFCGKPMEVCTERGIPYYLFHTLATRGLRFFMRMDDKTKIVPVTDCRLFDILPPPGKSVPEVSAMYAEIMLNIRPATMGSHGVLTNSFRVMDQPDLDALRSESDFGDLPMFYVGPIFPREPKTSPDDRVLKFLEKQPPKSTVYVSFGTGSGPSEEQTVELANALLVTGRPFVWALREQMHRVLPEAIQKKMQDDNAGFVITNWAPQKAVLASDRLRVFVCHCGWGGLMEGLYAGVAMVAWPMFGDQWLNAEWLAEHGVAFRIPDTKARGGRLVPASEIAEAIRTVAGVDGKVSAYQRAAERWQAEVQAALGPQGTSSKELEGFAMLTLNMEPPDPISD